LTTETSPISSHIARTTRPALSTEILGGKTPRPDRAPAENVFQTHRGLVFSLAAVRWIPAHQTCLMIGPTGAGKTLLACALGNRACRLGYSVAYHRVWRLLQDLALGCADGSLSYGWVNGDSCICFASP